jgi:hypothetical protein
MPQQPGASGWRSTRDVCLAARFATSMRRVPTASGLDFVQGFQETPETITMQKTAGPKPATARRPMTSRDKLAEAYEAWKRAADQHNDMMRSVMEGKPLDGEAMKQKLGEIESLHATWMELAQAPARK